MGDIRILTASCTAYAQQRQDFCALIEQNQLEQVVGITSTQPRSVDELWKRSPNQGVDVFTNEDILNAVHKFGFYKDSKDFVDSPLTADAIEVVTNFWRYVDVNSADSVKRFVDRFFEAPGTELCPHYPKDWQKEPGTILKIPDDQYRMWALALHELWKPLCRKVREEVQQCSDRFSLVYVPHSFIVPGGRFREFFYWDSYWIIKGLLVSEMFDTAKDMIRNLVYLVQRFGFIPNGGRTYFLNRSQPPFLIPMVYDYVMATNDREFLKDVLPVLVEENNWWYKHRTVHLTMNNSDKSYTMFQYRANTKRPRPESYKEDIETASAFKSNAEKELLYQNLASACESGWDFSSRWCLDSQNLNSCITTGILPVDLNAVLVLNAELLYRMHDMLGNETAALAYQQRWQHMIQQFNEVFWNDEFGCWFDYWISTEKHNTNFYGSSVVPIFAKCFTDVRQVSRCYTYIVKSGALSALGGIASSTTPSGQQWDFPNSWSPLVHMLIVGLLQTGDSQLELVSRSIAEQWLQLNHKLFVQTGDMFEKYNVSSEYSTAGGGEYKVQTGFGWTNGVVLDLLSKFHIPQTTN